MVGKLVAENGAQIIAVARLREKVSLVRIADALRKGGIACVEITMTTPGALRALEDAAGKAADMVLGAGTILDAPTARQSILAGAQFLVTPVVKADVIETARRYGVPVISGALTPTEILCAWEAGADLIKVFPIDCLGPSYIRAIHGPLPQVQLVPTGGVTAENAGAYFLAGAAMVCVGGWLINDRAVAEGDFSGIAARAQSLVEAVRAAGGSR